MNTPEINFLSDRNTAKETIMNRYASTKQITISLPCLDLGAIAQDIRTAASDRLSQLKAAFQRKIAPLSRKIAVAGMAIAVGVMFAIETYRLNA